MFNKHRTGDNEKLQKSAIKFWKVGALTYLYYLHAESQMLRLDLFKQAAGLGYFHLPTMGNTSQNSAVRILTWLLLFSVNVCLPVGTIFILFQM